MVLRVVIVADPDLWTIQGEGSSIPVVSWRRAIAVWLAVRVRWSAKEFSPPSFLPAFHWRMLVIGRVGADLKAQLSVKWRFGGGLIRLDFGSWFRGPLG